MLAPPRPRSWGTHFLGQTPGLPCQAGVPAGAGKGRPGRGEGHGRPPPLPRGAKFTAEAARRDRVRAARPAPLLAPAPARGSAGARRLGGAATGLSRRLPRPTLPAPPGLSRGAPAATSPSPHPQGPDPSRPAPPLRPPPHGLPLTGH